MQNFIEQAKHNEDFHTSICDSHPDGFFDWKITCLFYCAYHLLQALAAKRNVKIGETHTEIHWNINPKNPKRKLQVKQDFFFSYDRLFEYSRNSRYKGFTKFSTFMELKKADYLDALKIYTYLKKYVKAQGVTIN